MKRYLLAVLAFAILAGAVAVLIGGDDADSDDNRLGGRYTPVPSASVAGMPGPPWSIAIATPTPTPAPGPTDAPEPPVSAAAAVAELEAERSPAPVAPAPPPEPAAPVENDVVSIIHEVFGVNAGAALAVAWCESRFDPSRVGEAGERGLFQIHETHWFWMDEDLLFGPLYNAQMAFELSQGGTNWSSWAWQCQP